MSGRHYYTLVASLPFLPRFDRAERLPISAERLWDRFKMLDPEDRELAKRASSFLAWERQPVARTDIEMIVEYERMTNLLTDPTLKVLEFPINQRTILAALRRRNRNLPAPNPGEPWGIGPWVSHIQRNWDDPDFKLDSVYPWIPQAREYLTAGETVALDRLLLNLWWDTLDRLVHGNDFGFEAVLAYLLKWDVSKHWLSYDYEEAGVRFEELAMEIIDEHKQLFD
jgi:hypothetical protein